MSKPENEHARVLPKVPIPAAHRTGTDIMVLGLLLLLGVCLGLTPWYWRPHAPAIQGFLCGVTVCVGMMVLYWRFSLGLLAVTVLVIGACGTLGDMTGNLQSRTYEIRCNNKIDPGYAGDLNEDLQLLDEGLVATLKKEHVVADDSCPIEVKQGYTAVKLGLRLHADPRLRGLDMVIQRFISMKYGDPDNQVQGVRLYIADIASRFNSRVARQVAERSVALTNRPALKAQFLIEARIQR
jgi:hypothetical protein